MLKITVGKNDQLLLRFSFKSPLVRITITKHCHQRQNQKQQQYSPPHDVFQSPKRAHYELIQLT